MSWWKPYHLEEFKVWPMTWFSYGLSYRIGPTIPDQKDQYYFMVWLPSYGYEFIPYARRYGMIQRGFIYYGIDGFRRITREVP